MVIFDVCCDKLGRETAMTVDRVISLSHPKRSFLPM